MWDLVVLCLLVVAASSSFEPEEKFPYLLPSKLQTRIGSEQQLETAQEIISSYYKHYTDSRHRIFNVVQIDKNLYRNEKDSFTITKNMDLIEIRASSGVAAVWGSYHYLKHYLNAHIGWQTESIYIPEQIPYVNETVVANDRFRYYGNVCTHSYSFVWWRWEEWKKHITWMAFNGINMVLAPVDPGLRDVYLELGLTEDEISEHFTGPAFLAWQRMGNLRGWGGPTPIKWFERARELQVKIINLMQSLGMIPVLSAFAGHVPVTLARVFPNASFIQTHTWNKFNSEYCCPLFVHPEDPLFQKIADSYFRHTTYIEDLPHVYSADPFNELRTDLWSDDFVRSVSGAIFCSMNAADPEAVWLVQNWMFVHDPEQWPGDRVRTFLQGVPRGRLLVLDLQSEQWPQYDNFDMYSGQPFIWSMLHNFGGTLGMFGDLWPINSEVYAVRARPNSTMLGVGLTMEGINQNYVVYDLMLESAWRTEPVADLNNWTAMYAYRRYGCNETARGWRYLLRSVYAYPGVMRMRGKYVVTKRPSLRISPWAWYEGRDLFEAWSEFVHAAPHCLSDGYLHDLVDVTRQALQYRAEQLYILIVERLKAREWWEAKQTISDFLEVMSDMDAVLSTSADFSLAAWLKAARSSLPDDPGAVFLNELNARNQITLWGPNGEIEDYACKQWAGMFSCYYVPRWELFLDEALKKIALNGTNWDESSVQETVRRSVTRSFANCIPPPEPHLGSAYTRDAVSRLYIKWAVVPGLRDLPHVDVSTKMRTTFSDSNDETPSVTMTVATPLLP